MDNDFGIILTLTTLLFAIISCAIGILTRIYLYPKFDTKLKRLYANIPKIVLGVFGIIWFLVFRYISDVQNLIEFKGYDGGIYYSKVLLLDLCPFAYVVLCLFMIFDYNSKFINIAALWAIIGSSITIFGSCWFIDKPINVYKYIFIGESPNKLYYFLHAWMLLFGFYFFASSNKFNFYRTISSHIAVVVYLIYVLIIVKTLNVTRNATGLVEYDWMSMWGEYHQVHLMFKMDYPDIMWFSYFLVWLLMIVLIAIKNECHKPILYSFWPKIMYQKIKWLKRLSERYYNFKIKLFKIKNKELDN